MPVFSTSFGVGLGLRLASGRGGGSSSGRVCCVAGPPRALELGCTPLTEEDALPPQRGRRPGSGNADYPAQRLSVQISGIPRFWVSAVDRMGRQENLSADCLNSDDRYQQNFADALLPLKTCRRSRSAAIINPAPHAHINR